MWDYRVMKTERSSTNPAWEGEEEFVIAEVYYDCEHGCKKKIHKDSQIEGWVTGGETDNDAQGMRPWGGDVAELRDVLESMLTACDKPVLDEAELLRNLNT